MADTLADALNRVSANPQAADAPLPASQAADGLRNPMPRWQRVLAATLPEVAASVVSAPFSLYGLADMGSRWAFDAPLPGGQGAIDISRSITEPVRALSNKIAGEPIQDNLLSGDPLQVGAAWGRLALTAGLSAPTPVAAAITQGAAKLKSGIAVVDGITSTLGRALEVLTPITITSKPAPKLAALNIGVAGTIGAGIEAALGPADTLQKAVAEAEATTQGALDVAAQGAQEVQQADPRVTQAGFTTGSTAGDIAAVGLISAAALYGIKRDSINRIIEGRMRSAAGYPVHDPQNATTVTSVPTALKQQFIEGGASIPAAVRNFERAQGTPRAKAFETGDRVAEELSYRTGPAIDSRMKSLLRFGEMPDSTVRMPAIDDQMAFRGSLDASKQKMLDQVLIAKSELDARQVLLRDGSKVNVGPIGSQGAEQVLLGMERAGTSPRYNLFDTASADLAQIIRTGMADPDIAKAANAFRTTMAKMRDYMPEQRYRTKAEVTKMGLENPNYAPTRMAPGFNYMRRADQAKMSGLRSFEELGSPYEHLPKYLDEVVRGAEGEKIKRTFLLPMMRAADRGDKFASSIFGRKNVAHSPQSADQLVHYRDQYGVARNVEVKDAVLRNALRGVSAPSTLQMIGGMLGSWSRLVQSGSVGSLAAATMSNIFAPTSAIYSSTFGMAMRPKGTSVGWLDKLVQSATKGKVGVPGDPTFYGDVAFRAIQNIEATLVDRAARVMQHQIATESALGKTHAAQVAAKALSDRFKRTNIYDLQQRGLLGPASVGAVDRAREFNHAKTWLEKNGVATHADSFVGDILHAISSAPSMSLSAMNKGADKQLLNYAVRNFAGDPGRSGAFRGGKWSAGKVVGEGVNAMPFANLTLQNFARLGEAINRNPTGVAAGIFSTIALPALLSTQWNSDAGPEYADHQFNIRPPDKQASSIYIAIPGLRPEQGVEIPIDPTLRVFKYASELLMGSQLGLLDGSYYAPENSDFAYGMRAMQQHRAGAVGKSLLEQSFLPPTIPAAQLIAAGTGSQLRSWIDARPIPEAREKGFTEGTALNPQTEFLDNYMPSQTEEVLKSIGSQAFVNIYRTITDWKARDQAGVSTGENINRQLQAGKMRIADSTKSLGSGPLFNTFLAISPSVEASGSTVREKLNGLRKFSEAAQSGTPVKQMFVGTEKRGFQVREGQGPAAPADAEIAKIASQAQFIYKQLNELYLGSIKDDYSQRSSIQNNPQLSPEQKRARMNDYSDSIIDKNRKMLQDVLRYEAILSAKFGREIKFDKLKFNE